MKGTNISGKSISKAIQEAKEELVKQGYLRTQSATMSAFGKV
jgi:hypothetical protein